MMTRVRFIGTLSPVFLVVTLAACGGSKKPAAAPPAPPPAPASASSAPAAPPAPPPAASSAAAPSSDDSGPDESKPSQPPIDLMTQKGEAFVLDFQDSDIGAKAEKECHSSNPARVARCKKHKRGKFLADVLQFKKKGKKIRFYIYKRRYNRVTKLSVNEVKLTQKADNKVMVETLDKILMPRVLFPRSRKFIVTVPNDYSIQIKDPRYGKLVYEGKVDILGK